MASFPLFPYNPMANEEGNEPGAGKQPRFDCPPNGTIAQHLAGEMTTGSKHKNRLPAVSTRAAKVPDNVSFKKAAAFLEQNGFEPCSESTVRRMVEDLQLDVIPVGRGKIRPRFRLPRDTIERIMLELTPKRTKLPKRQVSGK